MKLKLAAALVAATMSSSVLADSYFSVNYVNANVDILGVTDASPSAVMMKYGSYMGENFSLEGRPGFGLSGDQTYTVRPANRCHGRPAAAYCGLPEKQATT